jgi:hypothetical protein
MIEIGLESKREESEDGPSSSEEEDGDDNYYSLALHSFVPITNSKTCLSFNQGQIIKTINKDISGWWDGSILNSDDNSITRGWFPSNYVIPCDVQGRTTVTTVIPTTTHTPPVTTTTTNTATTLVSYCYLFKTTSISKY